MRRIVRPVREFYVRIRKEHRPFQGKTKVTAVKGRMIWDICKPQNEKIARQTQYRLARILILDLYDSSKVTDRMIPPK